MIHMYPYANLNSFDLNFIGENSSSFFETQDFLFQQQQNWNLYNQLTDPFIIENNHALNALTSTDQISSPYHHHLQQSQPKKQPNHIYSTFTIPSITSIISQPTITGNLNTANFLFPDTSSSSLPSSDHAFSAIPPSPSSMTPPTSSSQNSLPEIEFNPNVNLLIPSSNNASSYFVTPDKETTISLQDLMDGMKVMQDISTNDNLDSNLFQEFIDADLNDDQTEWLVQENTSNEEKPDEKFRQDIDDLIEEHMKEMKKFIHNEVLCQEILTESSSLEFQDLSLKDLSQTQDDENCSSTSSISTIGYRQEGMCPEVIELLPSSDHMFIPPENHFLYDTLAIEEISNLYSSLSESKGCSSNQMTLNRDYDCRTELKPHTVTHMNEKFFVCNVLGCDRKFEGSNELITHQLDHLN